MKLASIEPRPSVLRQRVAIAAKIALSVVLLWWIATTLNIGQLEDACSRLSPLFLVAGLALIVVQTVVIGWRWHRVVALLGDRLQPAIAIRWTFVGLFFNQALPGSVGGDVVRVLKLTQLGTRATTAIASVAIERLTGIVLLALLVSVCAPAVVWQPEDEYLHVLLLLVGPLAAAALYLLARWHGGIAEWLPLKIGSVVLGFGEGMKRLFEAPSALSELIALSIAANLLGICAAWVIGWDLGIPASFPAFVALLGAVTLFSVIPVSAGGWGVREASAVMLFGAAGILPEHALTISVVYGLLLLAASLPVGIVLWLFRTARKGGKHGGRSVQVETRK